MKERPIPFTTGLIPKILDGTKTQTRRTKGLNKINQNPNKWTLLDTLKAPFAIFATDDGSGKIDFPVISCPYGQVGDRLWLRETFAYESPDGDRYVTVVPNETKILYHATDEWEGVRVPSIFMPRWASRITLEITALRVERLQEITEEDALAEGIGKQVYPASGITIYGIEKEDKLHNWCSGDYRMPFITLWNPLNAKRGYSWESNPWVWVIEFKKLGGDNEN